jgi:large subunit ribosomal protein L31
MKGTMMNCGSRSAAFTGSSVKGVPMSRGGVTGATMMKKDIHPQYFAEAKVTCNGVEVMTVSGTKPKYNVEIYSGNHPFYQGNKGQILADEGRVSKFKSRFAELDDMNDIMVGGIAATKAEIEAALRRKPKPIVKGGGKKKK